MLDTGPDAELFVGREAELTRLQRAVELGLNAVVVGEPGTGTSSLLRHLAWSMRSRKLAAPIQVGAAAAEDVPTLLR
ncbi:MAG: ATPase domain, partial [Frankiaceae bacterium]|nr:ATPase domain [Frankiaceae bacterium]